MFSYRRIISQMPEGSKIANGEMGINYRDNGKDDVDVMFSPALTIKGMKKTGEPFETEYIFTGPFPYWRLKRVARKIVQKYRSIRMNGGF